MASKWAKRAKERELYETVLLMMAFVLEENRPPLEDDLVAIDRNIREMLLVDAEGHGPRADDELDELIRRNRDAMWRRTREIVDARR